MLGIIGVVGLFFLVITIVSFAIDGFEKRNWWITPVAIALVFIAMIGISFYKNKEIISTVHHTLISNEYNNKIYSDVVTIDYDVNKYHWWTWNLTNNNAKTNVTITSQDKIIIKDEN
jgi:apolipoprotein N-acyltransferase